MTPSVKGDVFRNTGHPHQLRQATIAPTIARQWENRFPKLFGAIFRQDSLRQVEEAHLHLRAGLVTCCLDPTHATDLMDMMQPQQLQINKRQTRETTKQEAVTD